MFFFIVLNSFLIFLICFKFIIVILIYFYNKYYENLQNQII
nr:MAG TPA: hypothetical protein [Caudoviricetes sp.]